MKKYVFECEQYDAIARNLVVALEKVLQVGKRYFKKLSFDNK